MGSDMEDQIIWQSRDEMPAGPTNALQALRESYTLSSRNMSESKFDAWIYGIIVGWDDASYRELQPKHGWTDDQVLYNKLLHENYKQAWIEFMKLNR